MSSKQINILPVIAASTGCTASCSSYYTGTGGIGYGPAGSQYEYTNFQLVATAASGWAVDRIVYHYSWSASDGTSGTSSRTTRNIDVNPFYQPDAQVFTTYEWPGDFNKISGGDWPVHTTSQEITSIDVYFKTGPTPPPGVKVVSAYASPSDGGTVQVGSAESGTTSSQGVETGGSINVVATVASGYEFSGWWQNNVQISGSATYTVSNVTDDQTFEARFTPVYTITAIAYWQGRVSINGSTPATRAEGTFHAGDVVTLDAYPYDSTVYFDRWILGTDWQHAPGIPGAGAHYQITVGNTSQVYGAVFNLYAYVNIYVLAKGRHGGLGAKVYFNGVETQENEDHVTPINQLPVVLSATATGESERDRFIKWILYDGSDIYSAPAISTSLSFSFSPSNPQNNEDYFVCAVYEYFYPMEVSANPQNGGTASISTPPDSGDKYYLDGTSITIVATPAQRFRFVKWRVRVGSFEYDFSSSATYTFTVGSGVYQSAGKYIAYFEYDGTDLLVNSFSLITPTQLVYDESSGLLVADY